MAAFSARLFRPRFFFSLTFFGLRPDKGLVLYEEDCQKFKRPEDAKLLLQMLMTLAWGMSVQLESGFAADGQSAKKAFLKSPLKYTFITSTYGGRQHPVLGFHKQHQGVDLRAAEGTPVWSVADGTVVKAVKNDRAAGNYVVLRHANGMETYYLHLG